MAHVANLTIDNTKVAADLTDFPVYVNLADLPASFWNTVANGGGDIRVFKSDGTTELAREVVSCNTATDTGELHFKYSGTLSGSADTTVQIHADGTSADYAVTDTYGRNNVWSGHNGVYHFQPIITDSTANGYTLTNTNTVTNGTGKIGDDADFGSGNTSKRLVSTPSQISYAQLASGFAVSFWIYPQSLASNNRLIRYVLNNGSQERNFIVDLQTTGAINQNFFSGSAKSNTSVSTLSVNNWYHIVAAYDGQMRLYINGSLDKSDTWTWGGYTRNTLSCMALGAEQLTTGGSASEFYKGRMDEARFTTTAAHFTADWITTEYNNQNSPSTFYTASAVASNTSNFFLMF
jgi:hypothetical protein